MRLYAVPLMSLLLMPQAGNVPANKLTPGTATLPLLGSLCLFLSAIEYIIPKPLPFMRIGLANLPLLLALDLLSPADFLLLILIKVMGQGILSGSLFSYIFLFSLAGTFSSAALMYGMRKLLGKKHSGFAGIGCAGALLSNGVQLLLARYLIFGASIQYLAPPFLAAGFISGITLGVLCEIFCRRSQWYAICLGEREDGARNKGQPLPSAPAPGSHALPKWEVQRMRRREQWNKLFKSPPLFCGGAALAAALILSPSLRSCGFVFLFLCVLAWISGKKTNIALTITVMAGIVFFNLFAPYGKVLFEIGALHITQGSLEAGLRKALILEGLVMLSGACIKSDLRLPGRFGCLLAESFRLLEKMREYKANIRRGRIIEGIDRMLMELGR